MAPASKRHPLPGSERQALPGATAVGDVHPGERIEVTLRLRPKAQLHALQAQRFYDDAHPGQRRYLSRGAFAAAHGADAQDIARIVEFAQAHGLAVVETHAARRSVVLAGDARSIGAAFGVTLQQFEHGDGAYRGHSEAISVPANLAGIVEGVFGLDNRPQAQPHFQRHRPVRGLDAHAATSFTPTALAQIYGFPPGSDGTGQCIGLIELGGGYRPRDLEAYFAGLGLHPPSIKSVSVDHGRNHPTNADSADGEVMLDVEVAAAVAPKAAIVVYFAPNTDQGFLDAITTAVHDSVHQPSVISISWGAAESAWAAAAMTQFDQEFQAAAAMGVTVCCAAGDNGSADGVDDGHAHVDFPASSPHALGCGGTRLVAAGATIRSETVWNEGTNSATGGGVSTFFERPAYQASAHVPPMAGTRKAGRGVPDIGGVADPATGYEVRVDGQQMVIGGTSAVAPLWAGLIARLNQALGHPVGFLNPLLYGSLAGRGVTHDVASGNNGAYTARQGWDACTGWGSPDGTRLLQALTH